jgi:RNase P protein component
MSEVGFPLMETDEENFEIFRRISQSMKSNCKLIFTTLNDFSDIQFDQLIYKRLNRYKIP